MKIIDFRVRPPLKGIAHETNFIMSQGISFPITDGEAGIRYL